MAELDPREPLTEQPAPDAGQTPSSGKRHRKRTIFYIVAVVIALLLFTIAVMDPIVSFLRSLIGILSPLIIGAVIAYLCDPILEFFEYRIFKRMRSGGLRRGLSLLCTVLTAFGIVGLVGVMMIPQLINSLTELFENSDAYLNRLLAWIQSGINKLPIEVDISDVEKLQAFLGDMFGSVEIAISKIITEFQKLASDGGFVEKTWAFLLVLFNSFKNLFLGIFIAFYILASKEKRIAQIHKFRRAMFNKKTDGRIEEIVTLADKTFGGFIYGKILDSLVIGILTFVLLTIFEVSPYNLLIATFVGITNVIPVFGPFIGAIPTFFVVLISEPSKAFLFLVLILIIQQLDGNIIGPKILGDNTGVSSLCVIIAIAICSALWGVAGMILGVPIFAVVIELIKRLLEKRLDAKGEPTDTLAYYPANAVGNAEQDIYYEHATLRYKYERSKLKPHVDKWRNKIIGVKTSDEDAATDATTDAATANIPAEAAADTVSHKDPPET